MAKIDRSKYRASSAEEMSKVNEEISSREQTQRGSFIKIEAGINTIRIFPAPVKAKSSLYCFPKVTSFLPMIVDEVDSEGNKTGKQVEKRKAIFNAKIHGGLDNDIVEDYIETAKEYFSSTIKDKKDVFEKLKPLTNFKTGIKPASAWICYAYKKTGDKKVYGRLQITDGVHKQLDNLCLREGDSGRPIIVDLFSHPDTGKPIQWTSNPDAADIKARNKVSILFEKDCPLTDEELEMLEGWEPLENLYTNSYTYSDFEKQLKGLQLFDKNNKLGIFDSPSFQQIIERDKSEVEEKIGIGEEEEKSEKSTKSKSIPASSHVDKKEESSIPVILTEMDKKTLMSVIENLELETEVKNTTPPSKIREMIKESIISTYELEGSDEEINASITDIIENAFGDSEKEEESNETVEEEIQEEEQEDDSDAKNSVLAKYRRRSK